METQSLGLLRGHERSESTLKHAAHSEPLGLLTYHLQDQTARQNKTTCPSSCGEILTFTLLVGTKDDIVVWGIFADYSLTKAYTHLPPTFCFSVVQEGRFKLNSYSEQVSLQACDSTDPRLQN